MKSLDEIRSAVHALEATRARKSEAGTRRYVPVEGGLEIRAAGTDSTPIKIAGHAAVFGRSTSIGGMFTETVKRGAFRDVLDQHQDTLMLWNHDTRYPLARVANDTLKLREDPRGLESYAEVPSALSYARDLEVLIGNRTIAGMSFGFVVGDDTWTESTKDDVTSYHRDINSVEVLMDVSPVAQPAYPTTDIGLRSFMATAPDLRATDYTIEGVIEAELAELAEREATLRGYLAPTAEVEETVELALTDIRQRKHFLRFGR